MLKRGCDARDAACPDICFSDPKPLCPCVVTSCREAGAPLVTWESGLKASRGDQQLASPSILLMEELTLVSVGAISMLKQPAQFVPFLTAFLTSFAFPFAFRVS